MSRPILSDGETIELLQKGGSLIVLETFEAREVTAMSLSHIDIKTSTEDKRKNTAQLRIING